MPNYDLVISTPATAGEELNIVTKAQLKAHLRMAPGVTTYDTVLEDCITDAVWLLHGQSGELNRTVMPTTYKRYWKKFPSPADFEEYQKDESCKLWLPFPPVQSVTSVEYLDEDGATQTLVSTAYELISGNMTAHVELLADEVWPTTAVHPRAVTVTYVAGYTTYPNLMKRLIKLMAGHYWENGEATLNEPRVVIVNRMVQLGHGHLLGLLKVPLPYGDDR